MKDPLVEVLKWSKKTVAMLLETMDSSLALFLKVQFKGLDEHVKSKFLHPVGVSAGHKASV